jgi:hydroxymethylpyrimidine/phosphomethylpyrimidine kinase
VRHLPIDDRVACALAIGGVDPGGGAGLLADLRAFHACGVFGCAVVALVTVQSTDGLVESWPVAAALVVKQATEVMRVERVLAVKLGALGSVANVRAVARWLSRTPAVPVVLDPVMSPTRGLSRLLAESATEAMRDELLSRATLVTANAHEAAALTGAPVRTVADAIRAARTLVTLGAEAALVKGGHLRPRRTRDVVDVLALRGGDVHELHGPRLPLPPTHGGGCVLASLIAGELARAAAARGARGPSLVTAVRRARRMHQRALVEAIDIGGAMRVLVP